MTMFTCVHVAGTRVVREATGLDVDTYTILRTDTRVFACLLGYEMPKVSKHMLARANVRDSFAAQSPNEDREWGLLGYWLDSGTSRFGRRRHGATKESHSHDKRIAETTTAQENSGPPDQTINQTCLLTMLRDTVLWFSCLSHHPARWLRNTDRLLTRRNVSSR